MDKVERGTPLHSESLCRTCRYAQVMRGMAESQEMVVCKSVSMSSGPFVLTTAISHCSSYDDKRIPSRWDMEQIAWVLVTKKTGRDIGFVSAEDFRKQQSIAMQPISKIEEKPDEQR